jgi:O-antigen ligase
MFFAALAWGSNELWAMGLISSVLIGILAIDLVWHLWKSQGKLKWSWFYFPALALLAFIAVGILSGNLSTAFKSIDRYSTIVFFIWILCCIAMVFLVQSEFNSRHQIKILVICVLILGALEGIYGLIQYLGDYDYIWQYSKEYYKGLATGTLINRNHYALLVNLCICTAIGYLYYRSSRLIRGHKLSWRLILAAPSAGKLALIAFWIVIMGLGVVFSMSRMGIAAMIIGGGAMAIACNIAEAGKKASAVGMLIVFAVLGLAVYIGVDAVLARYENIYIERESDKDRIALWRDAWKMIEKHPIFGQGLGTFQWTFPAYESVNPDVPARYAHNDYLQALAEVGVVGLALLLWAFGIAWRVALKNLRHPRDPLIRGIGLGTIGALTVIALQEFTDFGLYIPGVAMLAAVLVGLNLRAQSLGSEFGTAD